MAKVYLGIDPGNEGAVAAIYGNGTYKIHDAPTTVVTSRKATKKYLSEDDMAYIIAGLIDGEPERLAVIEWAQASEQQGVTGAFNYGTGFGMWLGVLAALGVPHHKVRPVTWMAQTFSGRGQHSKELSRAVAKERFPAAELHLVKHHGRAEALLLAEFARKNFK